MIDWQAHSAVILDRLKNVLVSWTPTNGAPAVVDQPGVYSDSNDTTLGVAEKTDHSVEVSAADFAGLTKGEWLTFADGRTFRVRGVPPPSSVTGMLTVLLSP